MKGLAGCTVERGTLSGFRDARCVQFCSPRQDSGAGGFKHRVQPPDDCHGQDDVAVLSAIVDMMEHVVGDAPDERVDVHADTRRAKGTTLAGRISSGSSPALSTDRCSRGLTAVSSHKAAITPSSFWLSPVRSAHRRGWGGRHIQPHRRANPVERISPILRIAPLRNSAQLNRDQLKFRLGQPAQRNLNLRQQTATITFRRRVWG
jgi:hypothetical protein